ncbi:histone H1-like [Scyliorhinus canicula]|uniref:histone H1-like n=1 Tax=Scyliorhinus canicula TaxID=7830 RepID=UPI0018F4BD79|nr:histone H1-like [Scyliorhinus canicula]
MTETAASQTAPPAAPAPVKSPRKKKAAPRSKAAAPKLGEQILKLVAGCSDRNGMSLFAIKKALSGSGVDVAKRGSQIRLTIKRKVEKGSLVQTKGQGASGSFKIPKKESQGKMGKVKKPTAKKSLVKKTAAKKVRTKKIAAHKSPAKKSVAKKTPVKKSTVRKTSSKKAAAANKAVKKAALKKKSPGKKVRGGKPLTKVNQWKAKPKVKAAKAKKAAPGKK